MDTYIAEEEKLKSVPDLFDPNAYNTFTPTSSDIQSTPPDLSTQDKERHFHRILTQANLNTTLPPINQEDKNNCTERQKTAVETSSDAINDTIASLKADLGIMHETLRIKTVECEKLNQYVHGVERDLVNAREGRDDLVSQLIFHQGDHIKIAQISQALIKMQETLSSQSVLINTICENLNTSNTLNTGCPKNNQVNQNG